MSKNFKLSEKIYQDILLLTANDEFMKDVQIIRNKCNQPPIFVTGTDGESFDISYCETPEFQENIKELIEKYNLSELHYLTLQLFCSFKKEVPKLYKLKIFPKPLLPERFIHVKDSFFLDIWQEKNEPVEFEDFSKELDSSIAIKIYPETTKKDMIEAWSEIAKERDRLFEVESKKSSKIPNLKRDLYILRLKEKGKTCTEIIDILKMDGRFKENIPPFYEISKITKRLVDRAKRNVPSKRT